MRAVIFANGILKGRQTVVELLLPDDLIIAADGGAKHCAKLDLKPKVLIGDLDSISKEELAHWREAGTEIIQHDPDKDETDLELALLYAKEKDVQDVLILGGLGGRWDATFANVLLPAYERLFGLSIAFWDRGTWLYLVESEKVLRGCAGQRISLIPIEGDAKGVTTQGLKWPLNGETLYFGATRGVSNLIVADQAAVSVREGRLLCVISNQESGN